MSYFIMVLRNLLKRKEATLKPFLCGKMPRYEFERTPDAIYAKLACDDCGITACHVRVRITDLDYVPNPEERIFTEAIIEFNRIVNLKRKQILRTAKADRTLRLLKETAIAKGLASR